MNEKTLWLHHPLDPKTPLYGGESGIEHQWAKTLKNGDSCNKSHFSISAHAGTHVDAPLHFIEKGQRIGDYKPSDWIFQNIQLMDLEVQPGTLIEEKHLSKKLESQTDLLLLRTGFEKYRGLELYWKENPGVASSLASILKTKCPNIKAIGFDFISLSSFLHREEGREAHRAFLGRNIRIFEDLSLKNIHGPVNQIVALPLFVPEADAAPLTVMAWLA